MKNVYRQICLWSHVLVHNMSWSWIFRYHCYPPPGLAKVVSPPASVPEEASLPPSHLSPATSTSVAPAPSSDGKKVEEWKCILNCDETFSTRKELSKHLTSCFEKVIDMPWG